MAMVLLCLKRMEAVVMRKSLPAFFCAILLQVCCVSYASISALGDTGTVWAEIDANGEGNVILSLRDIESYTSADCSGQPYNTHSDINMGEYTFTSNQPFYFGEKALSKLSNDTITIQCIQLQLREGSTVYMTINIKNLSCTSTLCQGGSSCYTANEGWLPGTSQPEPACS